MSVRKFAQTHGGIAPTQPFQDCTLNDIFHISLRPRSQTRTLILHMRTIIVNMQEKKEKFQKLLAETLKIIEKMWLKSLYVKRLIKLH